MTVREYTKNDIDKLTRLWTEVFGDSEKFVLAFFELLPEIGTCVLGEEDGHIVAMASVLTEMSIVSKDTSTRIGYIYAVAVDERFRKNGYGVEISKAAYNKAVERKAEIVTTMPASDSLYKFYSDALGMHTALYRNKYNVYAEHSEKVKTIYAGQYEKIREKRLEDKVHLKMSAGTVRFLGILCKEYGGGLYITDSGICCAQVDDDRCVIYEIISECPEKTASSVAYALEMKKAEYYLPAVDGEKFIMACGNTNIPEITIYNVAFE